MTNYPHGLSSKDMDYIEGRHYDDMTDADRDDFRGAEWMRSLPVAEHAAIPLALDAGAHIFQASCRCKWKGPVHRRRLSSKGWDRLYPGLNTDLWLAAAADADAHNAEHAQ
jgi:hypothetical protein